MDVDAHLFSSSPARPSHHRAHHQPKPSQEQKIAPPIFATTSTTTSNPRKRSAAAANLITPPTSPRHHRSKEHGFSSSEEDDDQDQDEALESSGGRVYPTRSLALAASARKTTAKTATTRKPASRGSATARLPTRTSPRRAAVMAKQVEEQMKLSSGPVTPPKRMSTRANGGLNGSPARLPFERATTPTPAPRKLTRGGRPAPIRDSPNNPFLGSSPRQPAPREALVEKPTVTYVFRGVKAVFRNPAYGSGSNDASELSPSHPDFSPDMYTAPKLLWPSATLVGSDHSSDSLGHSPKPRTRAAAHRERSPDMTAMVSSSPVRQTMSNKRRRLAVRKNENDL